MKKICLTLLIGVLGCQLTTAQSGTQTTFFQQLDIDRGYALCPNPAGNLYVAGMKDVDMVLLEINPDGAVVACMYIDVGFSGLDVTAGLLLDSEGMLVVCGNLTEDSPQNSYVFRYNPAQRKVLWARTFGFDNTLMYGLLENGPGGNYFVYGNPHFSDNSDDAEFFQLDRNTGNMVPGSAWRYNLGASDQISTLALQDGVLYAVGRFTDGTGSGSLSKMRHTLLKIDPASGAPVWTRLSHIDPDKIALLYGRDLVMEPDAIISVSSGDDAGTNLNNTSVFVQKTSLDGDLIWVKKVDLPNFTSEFAEEIVRVPDGYIVYGRTLFDTEGALFLFKVDNDGNLVWARKIKQGESKVIGAAQDQLVIMGDYLYATGYSIDDNTGDSRMFLLKAGQDGFLSDSCPVFTPLDAFVSDVPDAVNYAVDPEVKASPTVALDWPVAPPVNFMPQRQLVCFETVDDCQTQPDITFRVDSISCAFGKMQFHATACNEGGAPVGDFAVRFYLGDPTKTAAQEFASPLLTNTPPLLPGQCRSLSILQVSGLDIFPAGLNGTQDFYFVANHAGGWPTPFSLDSFPSTDVLECNYLNNLSSTPFTHTPAPPNLGPDVVLCQNDEVVLDAGAGYYDYRWQDGSDGQTLTAKNPGVYWVQVQDQCGFIYRDSVTIEAPAGPSNLSIQCPATISVQTGAGANTATVDFNDPITASDCPCGAPDWIQTQGPASGAAFPVGQTVVCFQASDDCNTSKTCCFTVSVEKAPDDEPCDVKETPCIRFEILEILQNPQKQKTYRMRVTNKCPAPLQYIAFELPGNSVADLPANNSVYTSPAGRQYEVRNPNTAPVRSVRFKAIGTGIQNGASDLFEYTLPPNISPTFIYALARLSPQQYFETHLNVFACEVRQISNRPEDRAAEADPGEGFRLYPNPADQILWADLSDWENQRVQILIYDAYGRVLLEQRVQATNEPYRIDLPGSWADGLYFCTVIAEDGERRSVRFLKL